MYQQGYPYYQIRSDRYFGKDLTNMMHPRPRRSPIQKVGYFSRKPAEEIVVNDYTHLHARSRSVSGRQRSISPPQIEIGMANFFSRPLLPPRIPEAAKHKRYASVSGRINARYSAGWSKGRSGYDPQIWDNLISQKVIDRLISRRKTHAKILRNL